MKPRKIGKFTWDRAKQNWVSDSGKPASDARRAELDDKAMAMGREDSAAALRKIDDLFASMGGASRERQAAVNWLRAMYGLE